MSNPNTIMRDETIPEDVLATARDMWADATMAAMPGGIISTIDLIARAILAERAAENERCAKICENEKLAFLSPEYASNQPFGSITERFACDECAQAIRSSHD